MDSPRVHDLASAQSRRLDELRAENAELRARLEEAEETLRALREGEVDAIVVGTDLYTLEGANAASNRFRGDALAQMQEAVIATDEEGRITYLNLAAETMYRQTASLVLGCPLANLYTERPGKDSAAARSRPAPGCTAGRTAASSSSRPRPAPYAARAKPLAQA